jgi:anaerobic selenocysteine-containing dehydrogenase
VADIHRGPSQHTNGFYNNLAWYTLNCLIGNPDHKGGMIKLSTYDRMGAKPGQPFNIGKLTNGKAATFGVDLVRSNTTYEKSTLFAGYPAKRPWFPLATDIYQEDLPSAGDAYPYPIKILFTYMNAMIYSLPAGHTGIEIISDPKKIPLVMTSDIMVGETSSYADYVFPDLTYLERWEFQGSHPSVPWKVENVRNPAIAIPGWPTTKVFGEEIPVCFEAVFLALAERLGLSVIGLYQEKTAGTINSMTGKTFTGYATYIPAGLSSTGEAIADPGYDLHLITYKEISMAKARGISNYWLTALMAEGFILMNKADADRFGLRNGEMVKLSSASNPEGVWPLKNGAPLGMIGKLKVVQGIRPGVVAFPLGFGHWASGARDVLIDGQRVKGDPRRAASFHGNAAMRIDPVLKNVTLSDLAGGSAVFYDTKVKVVRA